MAAVDVLAHAWKDWGIQALVLLSFTLQVTLLVSAEFRRRVDSGALRFLVWSAYMMADGTAIYVLGHLSVTSRLPEHQLMAFWAPFLLLHLGGQDNITAYAIEDNRLWLRHLQTLAVQVTAAGYVLYESSIFGSHYLLSWATILMFVIGAFKYGERVWALRCAGSSPIGKNYRTFQPSAVVGSCQGYLDDIISTGPWDKEAYLLMAHQMLDVPMDLLKGPLGKDSNTYDFAPHLRGEDLYQVVEMQLSLMHDVFYTKMEAMHSNFYGLCMHILPVMAVPTAFLLFHLLMLGDHGKANGYNRLDVVVTYVLLVGAVILETVSLLGAMFSSWTCPLLVRWGQYKYGAWEVHTPYNYLGRTFTSLRRLVHAADWRTRYWSGSIGQHNLLQLGARSRASLISKMARWIGLEDWWNTQAYSWSIPVPESVKDLLVNQVLKGELASDRSSATGGVGARARIPYHLEVDGVVGEQGGEDVREEGTKGRPYWEEDKEEHDVREEGSERRPDRREDEEETDVREEGSKGKPDRREDEEEEDVRKEGSIGRRDRWEDEEEDDVREEDFEGRSSTDHQLFDSRGRAVLKRWGLYKKGGLTWSLDERILVWHVATSIYFSWWYRKHTKEPKVEAVEALSNYMMFLLAARPYMLSPTTSRNPYVELCYGLTIRGPQYNSSEQLASVLLSYGDGLLADTGSIYTLHRDYGFFLDFTTQHHLRLILQTGCKLGAMLVRSELQDAVGTLEVMAQVWVETLCYASQQCSADSHAKQLSNGGDLITIAALLVKYLTKSHFPTVGTHFDPQHWHRGGPFGSCPSNKRSRSCFFERAEGSCSYSESQSQPRRCSSTHSPINGVQPC